MTMTEEMTAPEKGAPWMTPTEAEVEAQMKADWEVDMANAEMTVWIGADEYTVTPEGKVEWFHDEPEIGAYGWVPVDEADDPEVIAEVMAMWKGKQR